jgi:Domain of unknown function (DUF1905)/Bacteriocin-protection, YdeI or OmpD-Associated
MRFRTTILQGGKTAAGIEVPPKVVTALGSSKRPAVRVTIKGYTYRSTVATMDGKFMVGVSATVREAARVAGDDTVDVDIELDTAPREVTVPDDFAKALKKDAAARKLCDGLSYSRKLALVGPINDAKTDETRQRRFDKALAALRDGTA